MSDQEIPAAVEEPPADVNERSKHVLHPSFSPWVYMARDHFIIPIFSPRQSEDVSRFQPKHGFGSSGGCGCSLTQRPCLPSCSPCPSSLHFRSACFLKSHWNVMESHQIFRGGLSVLLPSCPLEVADHLLALQQAELETPVTPTAQPRRRNKAEHHLLVIHNSFRSFSFQHEGQTAHHISILPDLI